MRNLGLLNVLVGNYEGKRQLGRSVHRCEHRLNIKSDLKNLV
jgi:hypothetical protein